MLLTKKQKQSAIDYTLSLNRRMASSRQPLLQAMYSVEYDYYRDNYYDTRDSLPEWRTTAEAYKRMMEAGVHGEFYSHYNPFKRIARDTRKGG